MRRRGAVRVVALGVTALVVSGLLAGCPASDEGGGAPRPRGEITFGVLAPLSGDMAERGQDLVDGAQMAAAEINDQGGVLGRQVRLAVEDGGCGPATGEQAATRLAAKNVVGMVGGLCEDAAVAAAKTAQATPFMVSSAPADRLLEAGLPSVFPMEGTVYQEALAAVHWMGYRSPQQVAVLGDGSPASQRLSGLVTDRVKADGLKVSMRSAAAKDPDLAELGSTVTSSKADFVYWTGTAQPGGRLVSALRQAGYTGYFMASAESDSPDFLQAAGGAAEDAYLTTAAGPQLLPAAAEWAARFKDRYRRDPGRDAMQAYDALRALVQAVRQAGDTDPSKVLDNLPRLEDFTTFTGTLRFAADHSLMYDNYVIAQVKGGKFTLASKLRTD
ncbi:amino acid/amide ABC transporter substrate-binding protein, HAAT family [Micromonospora viridifaciens]|uniref:Amino acid/amide ABC transporter substrate-binding protein, HAAT family n=1 Tax=Micromonospora viridifaciens TaxID=1881 RepID=A0A1C4WQ13_MICVI|nr:branched-chain amino acid ABC transporter substrate-binding protein [Micromonospora viridifaciens]SCE98325.1 amino acid/amide ABC transporter substrate-binding protein, HAAT family [Micromonospora viridifaciens]